MIDSMKNQKLIVQIPVCRTKQNKILHRPVAWGTPRQYEEEYFNARFYKNNQ